MNNIILVDKNDNQIGVGEKLKVHQLGLLHRAFSIFVFNSKKELLLQKRAKAKYHSGGLWANTCCSHPKPGEQTLQSVHSRLKEEMGFDCPLKEIFSFVYRIKLDNNFFENEYDHVFVGQFDEQPNPNSNEIEEYKWMDVENILLDFKKNPQDYAFWFKKIFQKVVE